MPGYLSVPGAYMMIMSDAGLGGVYCPVSFPSVQLPCGSFQPRSSQPMTTAGLGSGGMDTDHP